MYSHDTRKAVKAEFETLDLTVGQVTKLVRQKWDKLDAESKAQYEMRAAEAKTKYDEAISATTE